MPSENASPLNGGGSVLKCSGCFRELDALTGAHCERCRTYHRGYSDGRADKTRELLAALKGEEE